MVESRWKATFAWLTPLHEGLPDWFPKLINHVLRFRQGRYRFNLYNTCRALSTDSNPRLDTQQLRDTLERFVGHGLRFTGSHAQKVILDNQLILFWNWFFIPACNTSFHDLAVFYAALQTWRFEDLSVHPIIKQLLLPSYRSFTKEHVTKHCLGALFSNPGKYQQFVDRQVAQLSPSGSALYSALRQGPQLAQDAICTNNEWLAACELWGALLVHPTYETRDGKVLLRLETFKGHEMPFYLAPATKRPTFTTDSYLEPIGFITSRLLQGHAVPLHANNYRRTFPERQLNLFKEQAEKLIDEIWRFIVWWHDMFGQGCVALETLPSSGWLLTSSASGKYAPLIVEHHNLKYILEISRKFRLITNDVGNCLTLSPIGCMFICITKSALDVKTIWARNVDRLSLSLGEGWSDTFRRFLALVATSLGNGEYVITPASLAESGLNSDLAMVIIGGFTRLNARQIKRLSGWTMDT